jgi:hypothetical protein
MCVITGTTARRWRRRRLTTTMTPEAEYKELGKLLKEGSNHSVLRNGMWLGKQLVELADDEETAWAILAGFWAEMVLYVVPSENLKRHKTRLGREGGGGLQPNPYHAAGPIARGEVKRVKRWSGVELKKIPKHNEKLEWSGVELVERS